MDHSLFSNRLYYHFSTRASLENCNQFNRIYSKCYKYLSIDSRNVLGTTTVFLVIVTAIALLMLPILNQQKIAR